MQWIAERRILFGPLGDALATLGLAGPIALLGSARSLGAVGDAAFGGAAVHRYAGVRPHNPRAVVDEAGAFVDEHRCRDGRRDRQLERDRPGQGRRRRARRGAGAGAHGAGRGGDVSRLRRARRRPQMRRPARVAGARRGLRCRAAGVAAARASSARSGSTPGPTRSRRATPACRTCWAARRRWRPAVRCRRCCAAPRRSATTGCTARCSRRRTLRASRWTRARWGCTTPCATWSAA